MRRRVRALLAVTLTAGLVAVSAPAAAAPGPPAYPEFWFDQWGVQKLWAAGVRGGGITVAVIDTGVQASVPQMSRSVLAGTDLTGLGGDGRTDRSQASFSHGTAMASLIVAQGGNGDVIGVAPDAKILPIAVPLGNTDNARPEADETPGAIRYAVDHGAKIVSMSFGAERSPAQDIVPCPSATQSAVFYALSKGAILLASAGNSGDSGSPVEEPSVCLGVISVGAVDATDGRAAFSSDHPYLTLAAPGAAIVSLNRNGEVFVGSGTSQAAALASGALALIWSAHRAEDNRRIVARLMAGLRDAGPRGRDPGYGYGIVDAGTSAATLPVSTTPNPVFAGADPFLAQLASKPRKLTPPPAAPAAEPKEPFRRLAPATGLQPLTVAGVAAAAVAAVALLGLLVFGLRSRRRHASASAAMVPTRSGGPAGHTVGPGSPNPPAEAVPATMSLLDAEPSAGDGSCALGDALAADRADDDR